MDRKIIVFRFDTLSTMQCYSSEVTLKVDATKTPLQCWKDYLALLPIDRRYRYVVRHSTIDNKLYVTYENTETCEVHSTLIAIRYRWIDEKNFQLL